MATNLRNLRLSELSLVDRPANKGARVTLFKRDFSQEERDAAAESGAAMPDGSFPIKSTQDLKNAIHAIGRAKDPAAAKRHIISRAKALGATDLLPDGWVSKSAADGGNDPDQGVETMTKDELQKMIDDGVKTATADLTKKLGVAEATIAKMGLDNKKKPQAADAEKDGIPEPDADDEAKKLWRPYVEKRIAKAVEAALAKAAEITKGDEVIKVGDAEIRKTDVGDKTFAAMKAQQAQIADGIEKSEIAEFTKRAETELSRLPGEPIAKGKALRAIAKLAEPDRKAVEAMLKGGNAALETLTKSKGHDGAPEGTAISKLEKLAETHATEKKINKHAAMAAVLETPEGKALYTESLQESPRTAH